jgi:hypothetical protein
MLKTFLPPAASLAAGLAAAVCVSFPAGSAFAQEYADPLPSWADGPVKTSIVSFVDAVTDDGGPDFVPPEKRIATFDDDGTLWVEKPLYTEFVFTADRLRTLAAEKPGLKDIPGVDAVLQNEMATLDIGSHRINEIIGLTHAGMTFDAFRVIVKDWITTAKHPRFRRLYTDLAYQPMIEVLWYLRDNGFKTFIVSGGGAEFMREWTEPTYGIPPHQVVGSTIGSEFEVLDGKPVLKRLPKPHQFDNGPGKPVGIGEYIGQQPIIAFGNSDGDFEMLQYTTQDAGKVRRLGLIVHHDDAVREYAYDRHSKVGRLDRALNAAPEMGWKLISMKNDWLTIFAWPESPREQAEPSTDLLRPPQKQ